MTLAEALDLVVERTGVDRYRRLCDVADRVYRPEYPAYILEKAARLLVEPAPDPPDCLAGIPLAGDVVAAIAGRIGADRLAAWWERRTGRPCGCAERRERLNAATRTLLRLAGLGR